jgi:hypothetical protein
MEAARLDKQATDFEISGLLKPYAVKINDARKLLAGKCRSGIYEAIAAGKLDAIKDGERTLITVASIERYNQALPAWKLAKSRPPEKKKNAPRRRNRPQPDAA